ncbi:CLIP-associating protein 2-like [Branchiostoma floridae]|uniref:CLIP-associating protein 2-like n=1 Tax=Branchiostoma floridae TaxID=7739 RepID=A0A9J7MFL5_BRAFL|nr:CLIP-associating protein 2-like [Branchiostoma floridae]
MKILEAHKDVQKEVVRAAEETCSTAANSLQAEQCVRVLCPIVQTAEYPINLAAIKMLTKVRCSIQKFLKQLDSYCEAQTSMKLLNLYIKRAEGGSASAAS